MLPLNEDTGQDIVRSRHGPGFKRVRFLLLLKRRKSFSISRLIRIICPVGFLVFWRDLWRPNCKWIKCYNFSLKCRAFSVFQVADFKNNFENSKSKWQTQNDRLFFRKMISKIQNLKWRTYNGWIFSKKSDFLAEIQHHRVFRAADKTTDLQN